MSWTNSFSARLRDAQWKLKHGQSVLNPGAKLNLPPAPAPVVVRPEIVRADVGTCQYIIREDGKQKECGCEAAYKGRSRPFLLYCKTHGEFVGRSFEVVALDGSGRSLKPFRTSNQRDASSL
jgi:hypothetical protein